MKYNPCVGTAEILDLGDKVCLILILHQTLQMTRLVLGLEASQTCDPLLDELTETPPAYAPRTGRVDRRPVARRVWGGWLSAVMGREQGLTYKDAPVVQGGRGHFTRKPRSLSPSGAVPPQQRGCWRGRSASDRPPEQYKAFYVTGE